jgi:hypothetical protein
MGKCHHHPNERREGIGSTQTTERLAMVMVAVVVVKVVLVVVVVAVVVVVVVVVVVAVVVVVGCFGWEVLGAAHADKPQTSCESRAGTRCKLTTLRSTLPPQFSIQNPGSAFTPHPVDPSSTRLLRPHSRAPL